MVNFRRRISFPSPSTLLGPLIRVVSATFSGKVRNKQCNIILIYCFLLFFCFISLVLLVYLVLLYPFILSFSGLLPRELIPWENGFGHSSCSLNSILLSDEGVAGCWHKSLTVYQAMNSLSRILLKKQDIKGSSASNSSNSNKKIIISQNYERSIQNWKIPEHSSVYKRKGTFEPSCDYIIKTVEQSIPLGMRFKLVLSENLIKEQRKILSSFI